MDLLPHQKRIVDLNPQKIILAWETRVGKTLPAACWIDLPAQSGNTFIVCPKQLKQDWIRMGTRATILSKEEFKAAKIVKPTALVVDELHYFASPLFLRTRSQLATKLYEVIRQNPDMHFMGLTATPVRQDPWSLHTLLCYLGIYIDYREWRRKFFEQISVPYAPHPIWRPQKDWRTRIRTYITNYMDIVSLKDIVAYLPEVTTEIIKTDPGTYEPPENSLVMWTDEHQHEQKDKYKEILKLKYRKLIVIAHYTAQIDELAEKLKDDKEVFVLDGRTKDPDAVKKAARESEDCYFIVQASMGFGFDGYMFGAMVFASMSHSCTHHTQSLGRQRHMEHLRPITNYYLIGGKWDKRIMDTVFAGDDFNPHKFL